MYPSFLSCTNPHVEVDDDKVITVVIQNLSSFAFLCALAFAIERKIALAGDACSRSLYYFKISRFTC